MKHLTPSACLKKAQELCRINTSFVIGQGFIVTYTDWGNGSSDFDFYIAKEFDLQEGRIEALSLACYQGKTNQWTMRSRNEVDFWVRSHDLKAQTHKVSFVHPEDMKGLFAIDIVQGLAFYCLSGLAISQVGNRDKMKKLKKKLMKQKGKTLIDLPSLPGFN